MIQKCRTGDRYTENTWEYSSGATEIVSFLSHR